MLLANSNGSLVLGSTRQMSSRVHTPSACPLTLQKRCCQWQHAPAPAAAAAGWGARGVHACRPTGSTWQHIACRPSTTRLGATRADAPVDNDTDVRLIADVSRDVDGALAATVAANMEQGQAAPAPTSTPLRARVVASIHKVSKGLLERDTEVRASCGPGGAAPPAAPTHPPTHALRVRRCA